MLIDDLTRVLERSGALDAFWEKLDCGFDAGLGVAGSARPFLVAARFVHLPQPTLVVVAGEEAAHTFARSVAAYLGDERVLRFPARTDFPFARKAPDLRAAAKRMEAAHALQSGREVIVVASAAALVRALPPAKKNVAAPIALRAECELEACGNPGIAELGDLARALETRGFTNTGELVGPGTFAVRGGTVDIYPGNVPYPVRVDFFGDEVEEIRRVIPATGQTICNLPAFEVFPVREYSCDAAAIARVRERIAKPARTNPVMREFAEKLEAGVRFDGEDALLPYLYEYPATLGAYAGKKVLTVLVEPRSLFDDASRAYDDACARATGTSIPAQGLYVEPNAIDFGSGCRATYVSLMRMGGAVDAELRVKRTDVAGGPEKLFGKLRSCLDAGMYTVLSVPQHRARADVELALVDHHLPFREMADGTADAETGKGTTDGAAAGKGGAGETNAGDSGPRVGARAGARAADSGRTKAARLHRDTVNVTDADIPLGMILPDAKLAIIALSDTQGASAVRRVSRSIDVTQITFPYKPGDYVVHAAHGIALFKELTRREIDGVVRDYLLLEYAEGDRLFVPVEQLDRVTRYVGPDGASPRLTRLNTSDWSRAVGRVRKAAKQLAFDLVDVYARRAAVQGHRFGPDTAAQREMEDAFPYDETPDQAAAIAEVKADMHSSKPMDRLICGDVGFGKTEVALRAAFKATQDGKQVMVLCPTTILAQQHYALFHDRCNPFGVCVEVLSRFRTDEQQRATLARFKDGEVQILVGTHRLLSRDVMPRDLGLVIIDEEQRFGVGHKEQLKNLRESIDVLTLSATPIPRTLQMSLSGVRDMSLILTPPGDRRPVKVHVGEWDPDVVSAAIRRELARKGQVYYVSNRVRSITDAVRRVEDAAPEARVGVAHGQLSKEALERVMEEFSAGELDVLVATTIIESGIDNPHTNTLIIEDSQRLGLSQMYQLKGRVGRSATQAFAFFMFPERIPLTEEAEARLMALDEHQELGSGLRIAMRDLEIRGAGSLLGAEQSGNMSAVGFDLFAQMLATAVEDARTGEQAAGAALGRSARGGGRGATPGKAAKSGKTAPNAAELLPPALSDIVVNLPGHTYLPEEYMPDADERVRWYRRIACAADVETADALLAELEETRPGLPQAASNLFARARLKAFANEQGISVISVVSGSLIVEPITLDKRQRIPLRRSGGRYVPETGKLTLPLKHFRLGADDSVLEAVSAFLREATEQPADS